MCGLNLSLPRDDLQAHKIPFLFCAPARSLGPNLITSLVFLPYLHGSFFTALVADVLFCQPSICFSEDCCTCTCFSDVLIGAGELCVFLLCHLNLLPSPLPFTRQEPDAWETEKTHPPKLAPSEPSFVEVQW